MAYQLGLDAKLFYGEAGTQGKTELTNVKDVTLNLTTGEADTTTRAATGWRTYAATLKEGSLEFEMNWDTEDAGFKAVQEAFFSNGAIAFFVSDGAGNGLDADFVITAFTRNEPLEDAMTVSITARPTNVTRAPAWVENGQA